jgi:hypothetical protein
MPHHGAAWELHQQQYLACSPNYFRHMSNPQAAVGQTRSKEYPAAAKLQYSVTQVR